LLVVPSVSLTFFLLWMDRQFGTHFFDVSEQGQPLLWQHLFWIFGHPWVYAIVLPAMGMVSEGLPVFCRRPLVGYTPVALSTVASMILGSGVWVHHMFATGLPNLAMSFFSGAVDHHFGAERRRRICLDRHDLARPPRDHHCLSVFRQHDRTIRDRRCVGVHDRFRAGRLAIDRYLFRRGPHALHADWHQRLSGGGRALLLVSQDDGRMLDERLGKWNFWTMFIGMNLAFLPMHLTGLFGMPRRVYTFPDGMGWDWLNLITSLGAFLLAIGVLLLLVNVASSLRRGRIAGANPWDAATLEWSVPSPPPPYNFAVIPRVASGHPLWEDQLRESEQRSSIGEGLVLDHGARQSLRHRSTAIRI